MHPRTIMVVFASIWAAFYGAPFASILCAVLHGAWRSRHVGYVQWAGRDVKTRPIDTKGPGWKSSAPTAMHAVQAAGSQSGRWAEIRDSVRQPGSARLLGEGQRRLQFFEPQPGAAIAFLRHQARISAQGEQLLPVYDGPGASGQPICERRGLGGRQRRYAPGTALDATARLRGSPG